MAGKKAPANETAEQRFVRLANRRAVIALAAIDGLGKLVGSQYKSSPEQHKKLFGVIREKLDSAEKTLAANKPGARVAESIL